MPYDVKIERLPPFAIYDLKGTAKDLAGWAGPKIDVFAACPNSFVTDPDHGDYCHIGPGHWLLISDLSREPALEKSLRPADAPAEISIVRISDTQTFFRITGPDAMQVISIGCPMDLHKTVFFENTVSFTEFFALKALIRRVPDGFDIAVEQSFGTMIEDYLNRATT